MSPTSCQTAPPRTRRAAHSTSGHPERQYLGDDRRWPAASSHRSGPAAAPLAEAPPQGDAVPLGSGDCSRDLFCQHGGSFSLNPSCRPANAKTFALVGFRDDVEVHVLNGLVRTCSVVLQHVVFLYA